MRVKLTVLFFGVFFAPWLLVAASAQVSSVCGSHPWARHPVGTWKTVRVVTEAFDKEGRVESVKTEQTRWMLVKVDQQSYTLRVDVTSEVAGKAFEAEPQYITLGFNGETVGQAVSIQPLGERTVTIGGRSCVCQVRQLTIRSDSTSKVSTVYCSNQVAPYVLKSNTKAVDAQGKLSYENDVEVLALDTPLTVLNRVKPLAHVAAVQRQNAGTTNTVVEVHNVDVPGNIVSHCSREVDASGRIVQRSTLELVDYGVAARIQTGKSTLKRRSFHRPWPRTKR